MLEVALARHSADTAPAQRCIWSIRAFCRAGGRVLAQGSASTGGVAPGAWWWDDSVVVRVTDVAKRRRQGLVACRAALPFEGLLEDARPGVAPAPPFGAAARQSATSRRYACSAWDCSSRSAARCAVVGEMVSPSWRRARRGA